MAAARLIQVIRVLSLLWQFLWQLLNLWFQGLFLIGVWLWFTASVFPLAFLLDGLVGVGLIVWLAIQVPPVVVLVVRRWAAPVAWALCALTLLGGLLWLSRIVFPAASPPTLLQLLPPSLANEPEILFATLLLLTMPLALLIVATAWRVVWAQVATALRQPNRFAWRAAPSLMRLRRSWTHVRIMLAALLVIVLLGGTAAAANTSVIEWKPVPIEPTPPLPAVVQELLVDGRNGTLYAGTEGGVYRSRDDGQSWRPINIGLRDGNVSALALNLNDGTLYAGTTYEKMYDPLPGGTVYRSRDGGDSWQPAGAGLPDRAVSVLALDPRDGTLYAGVWGGLYRSSDGGDSWQDPKPDLPGGSFDVLVLDPRDGTLYAGSERGVYRSNDGGAGWQAAHEGMDNASVRALALDPRDGTLYAGTGRDGVYRSHNGGERWQPAGTGLPNSGIASLGLDPRDGTLYAGLGGVDPRDGGTLYAGTYYGVYRSSDGADSWQPTSIGLTDVDVLSLALDPRDSTLYAGVGNGVYLSRNGGERWQTVTEGPSKSHIKALALDSHHGTLYAATPGAMYRLNGDRWLAFDEPIGGASLLALDPRDGTLYAANHTGLARSRDGGLSWQGDTGPAPAPPEGTWSALALDPRDGTLYAGRDSGGVHYSRDGGHSWQALSAGPLDGPVSALLVNPHNGMLYAGLTLGAIYRASEGADRWQDASTGLPPAPVQALVADSRNGILYAGTRNGLYRSYDEGEHWEVFSAGLPAYPVAALAVNPSHGTLYAANLAGTYRSRDRGESWEPIAARSRGTRTLSGLALDPRDGTLYAGTERDGVYRSRDKGASWERASGGLPESGGRELIVDPRDGTLYTSASFTIYRSLDGGQSWQADDTPLVTRLRAIGLEAPDGTLYGISDGRVARSHDQGASWQEGEYVGWPADGLPSLVRDPRDGTLYYGTENDGVYRSGDGGESWQHASAGLTNRAVNVLALNPADGTLYAGTEGGVYRSRDRGQSWQFASARFIGLDVRALALDPRDGALYVGTEGGVYSLPPELPACQADGARDAARQAGCERFVGSGVVVRFGHAPPVWAIPEANAAWALPIAKLGLQPGELRVGSDDLAEVYTIYGTTVVRAELAPNHTGTPLAWLMVRALVWRISDWIVTEKSLVWTLLNVLGWTILGVALYGSLRTYLNQARPLGIPLWASLLARNRLDAYADAERLDKIWPSWASSVRGELLRFGDATPAGLQEVPGLFRHYALRRYASDLGEHQAVELESGRLRLLSADRVRRWQTTWRKAGSRLGSQPGIDNSGRAEIDRLAEVLAEALGLTLHEQHSFEAVRAYKVEAPTLRLNVPSRFPLIFVADQAPDQRTVQMLVDAVNVLRERDYFALVVPLEPYERQINVAERLRQAIEGSPHVQDFIVLSHDDVLDMLLARAPVQVLARRITNQIKLRFVSPFFIYGPVPETMFFGREAELRTLVEGAGHSDFAIIGNRKIGKTSLLQRAQAKLEISGQRGVLFVDCQTVRNATEFFDAFQGQTGLKLGVATPEGFATAIRGLRRDSGVPVLLMDEVDALLKHEGIAGELLAAQWRALSQAGDCHFVFCGSTGLARRLDDAHSVFFNFAQHRPLGYLEAQTANLVLTQPMERLNIILEQEAALLNEVYALTSGHPNLVQFVGQRLVEAANERQERRVLLDDVVALYGEAAFTDYFFKTIWGEAGPLEKLITLVAPAAAFRVSELETALMAAGVQVSDDVLDGALRMLQVYAILTQEQRLYRFVPSAFYDLLHRTQEVDRLIASERRSLARSSG